MANNNTENIKISTLFEFKKILKSDNLSKKDLLSIVIFNMNINIPIKFIMYIIK